MFEDIIKAHTGVLAAINAGTEDAGEAQKAFNAAIKAAQSKAKTQAAANAQAIEDLKATHANEISTLEAAAAEQAKDLAAANAQIETAKGQITELQTEAAAATAAIETANNEISTLTEANKKLAAATSTNPNDVEDGSPDVGAMEKMNYKRRFDASMKKYSQN